VTESFPPGRTDLREVMLANDEPLLRQAWHPVAREADLGPAPLPVELLGERWVIVASASGLRAFPDRCPHRRAPLSGGRVVEGTLECPYHGYRFDLDGADVGRCVAIPVLGETERLPTARITPAWGVTRRYGLVWLAPEQPIAGLPRVLSLEREDLAIGVIARSTPVSAGVLVDNFLDVAHFSYLHARTFGVTTPVTADNYLTSRAGWTSRLIHQTPLSPVTMGAAADQVREADYVYTAPYTVELSTSFDGGAMEAATLTIQPQSASRSTAYVLVAWPALDPEGLQAQLDFSDQVLAEDLAILEQIADPRLPLDVRAEFHTRGDKASVDMRRILSEYLEAAAATAPSGIAPKRDRIRSTSIA
jgi:phenylpropionate dioxygenase-like ring-hydroxylating dioxygenase large terminal subunit